MIILSEVAQKLEDILNGVDPEINALNVGTQDNPQNLGDLRPEENFYFKVATEGFHLDKNYLMKEKINFVPVFISSMGGNFNPVPELLQANYTIPIVLYFPVRFKDQMYDFNEYLARCLVGRSLEWGERSGRAISNVSVAQFGEIQDLDLKSFSQWQEQVYGKPVEIMEPYISMQITLYLSTASEDFIFGNEVVATLSFSLGGEDYEDNVAFVQNSVQSHSDPAVQQLMGTNESEGLPVGTSYASSFSVYVKKSDFYKKLIKEWFAGRTDDLTIGLNLSIEVLDATFSRDCYVQSVNLVIQKGELMTITFAFAKKVVLDNGGL